MRRRRPRGSAPRIDRRDRRFAARWNELAAEFRALHAQPGFGAQVRRAVARAPRPGARRPVELGWVATALLAFLSGFLSASHPGASYPGAGPVRASHFGGAEDAGRDLKAPAEERLLPWDPSSVPSPDPTLPAQRSPTQQSPAPRPAPNGTDSSLAESSHRAPKTHGPTSP